MAHSIAMWSGPRNISTAMLRSWGNRQDTFVCDEPLYAHYLLATGHTDHPGYAQTIQSHDTDWRRVTNWLTGPIPGGKNVFYQKHMAHHLLTGMSTDWIDQLTNCFLIRHPRETLLSLTEFLPAPSAEETGLPRQVELFNRIADRTATPPPVVDARDVLTDPAATLGQLCEVLGVPFDEAMLCWSAGPRDSDGAWAPHWYSKVYQTTSFGNHSPRAGRLPERLRPVLEECQVLYDELHRYRIQGPTVASINS
jgi:Sulfotransferase domain